MFIGPIRALGLAPAYYSICATVTDEGFKASGSVGVQAAANLEDITHVQLSALGRKKRALLDVQQQCGRRHETVHENNLWDQAALQIVARLKACGVEIEDEPGGP